MRSSSGIAKPPERKLSSLNCRTDPTKTTQQKRGAESMSHSHTLSEPAGGARARRCHAGVALRMAAVADRYRCRHRMDRVRRHHMALAEQGRGLLRLGLHRGTQHRRAGRRCAAGADRGLRRRLAPARRQHAQHAKAAWPRRGLWRRRGLPDRRVDRLVAPHRLLGASRAARAHRPHTSPAYPATPQSLPALDPRFQTLLLTRDGSAGYASCFAFRSDAPHLSLQHRFGASLRTGEHRLPAPLRRTTPKRHAKPVTEAALRRESEQG